MSSTGNSLVKAVVMVKRKKGISFEDFDKYWAGEHSSLVCNIPLFREKILKYNQLHLDLPRMQFAAENGVPVCNDFDGIGEVYAKSYQDLRDFFESDVYKNIVEPDERKFVEKHECKRFFVYDEVHYDANDASILKTS
ncbi:hypothetical protein R1sor_019798 [Riccia sorocarpa]|uniref:EthD domain-containing protein n=1 Tax=Riccia sorocarpa TaxID=122646 RepID=A0ABD3IEN1_9MARC